MYDVMEHSYLPEILLLLREHATDEDLIYKLSDYHDSDIADAFMQLTADERKALIPAFISQDMSGVFSYVDNLGEYLKELSADQVAAVMAYMDSDDAVDILEELSEVDQKKIVAMLDKETGEDIQLILSYEDDEIGSKMTTNYIVIPNTLTVPQAMQALKEQAGDNDNIGTIYVTDSQGKFYGAIELKDLIIARDHVPLEELTFLSYPFFLDHEKVSDCIERMKGYAEDSLPVLNEAHELLGIITSQDVVEVVDEEMGEDYAKLAGLTAEEDLNETTITSMKKRLPWLIVLLFLGIGVSSVVGVFEGVVASLPIIICFQSLILDMAGNVGTQSLAVTIRVLMDENIRGAEKAKLVFKEIKVGFSNGIFLGTLSFAFIGLYIWLLKGTDPVHAFLISACVGVALLAAMVISSLVGTVVPLFFHKIKVDPAVASGPLITTVNDLVAVITYYGLAWILLIQMLHIV